MFIRLIMLAYFNFSQAPKVGTVKKKFAVKVSFFNKLHLPLTNCELKVDGPGLQRTATYKQK